MSLKFLAGLIPLFLLFVMVWQLSRPSLMAVPAPVAMAAGGVENPVPQGLEKAVIGEYAEFDMAQAFTLPAGPRGLEYSPAARKLDGAKAVLKGSMVRHHHEDPSVFLLTPQPMALNMAEYGLADDLPPHAVHVIMPVLPGMAPDWVRQPLTIYGRLELGPREERDGRISQIRLYADHITAADGQTLLEPRRPLILQPARLRPGTSMPPTLSATTTE